MAETKEVVSPKADGVSTKDVTLTLDESIAEKLFSLVKYQHKDRIALFGIVSVQKEINSLSVDFIKDMIESRFKQLATQLKDRKEKDTSAYFRLLIAKGMPVDQAYKMAYGQ
jgi:hypothetical protein